MDIDAYSMILSDKSEWWSGKGVVMLLSHQALDTGANLCPLSTTTYHQEHQQVDRLIEGDKRSSFQPTCRYRH